MTPIIGVTVADNDTIAKVTGESAGISVPVRISGNLHLTATATSEMTTTSKVGHPAVQLRLARHSPSTSRSITSI